MRGVLVRALLATVVTLGGLLVHGTTASAATDVVIVFDTTGSMRDALSEAKEQVNDVIDEVDRRFGDVRYAVASVRDYGSSYGDSGDRPWRLHQPLTANRALLASAIDGLSAAGGGDHAESYGRALREADVNPSIGFRPGTQRLVVLVADDVPHDDDLNEGIPPSDAVFGSPFDTGIDPGVDEEFDTADDIDWQRQLADLKAHGIPLFFVLFKGDPDYLPYWRAWAGITGGSASTADDGELGQALVDTISAGAGGCSRAYERIGVLDVCADAIVARGDGTKRATGNVRIAGGVDAGAGPIIIDGAAQTLASEGVISLGVVRGSRTSPVGSGSVTIQTGGVKDEFSGRERLAPISLVGSGLASMVVGGVGLSPLGKYYIDPADGGGVLLTADPLLDLLGKGPEGTLAIGLHAASGYRVLGGSAGFNAKFGPPKKQWGLGAKLGYQSADDKWTLEGDVDLPGVIGGAKVTGALRSGKIDAFGLTIKAGQTGVPLGNTGFFFDSFSGEVAGLAVPPLRLTLGVTGGYGPKIPVIDKRPINLETAELSLATDLSGSIKGKIGLVDRRVAGGDLDISMHMEPSFGANGKLNADIALLGTGYFARTAIDMTSKHYTATGGADLKVAGRRMSGANAIISDEGTGASGKACGICPTVGVGIRWRNVLKFPPQPEWIGADIERYRTTASAAAARKTRRIRVAPGTAVLAVYGDGKGSSAADVELLAPGGRPVRPGSLASVDRTPDGRIAFTVLRPKAGVWRIVSGSSSSVEAQRVPPVGTLAATRVTPRGTKRKALRKGTVVVRWRVSGRLPRNAKVTVQTAAGRSGGVPLATVSARRGSARVAVRSLRTGKNRLSLVVSSGGIPFRRVTVPGVVYRR